MNERQSPAHQVTLFWAAVWLIAVCVIGILAGVAFYRFEVIDLDAQNRLLSIIIIGEVLLYFIVLLVPGQRVVPPGRTVLTVFLAMAVRAGMAVAVSQIVIARYAVDLGLAETWLKFYSTFWPAAVMQIGLIAVYLWLIRAALEAPLPAAERERDERELPEHLQQFRVPGPPDDEEARQRQEELLSALMEEPDEPVEWPAEVIAEAQHDRVKEETEAENGESTPETDEETGEGESTDTMPAVPALLADEAEGQQPPEEPPEPEGEEPAEGSEKTGVKTPAPEPEPEDEPEPSEEEVAEELIPPVAEEESEPAEPPAEAEAPEQPSLPMEEDDQEEEQPDGRAPMSADITSEQASMIEGAVTDLPDMPVSIAMSPSERPYALLGVVFSDSDEAQVTGSLDVLYATHRLVGDALNAGAPTSLCIMAEGGALILGASEQGGAGVAVYQPGEQKIGRMNLLARKAAAAAAEMPLDRPYDPGLSPATECTYDAAQTETVQGLSGIDGLRAYICDEYEIAITPAVPHPDGLAPAIAALAMAVGEAAQMLPATNPSRILVEYAGGGAVIASCGDRPTLVVAATGPDGTMGAANVQARNICQAIEEG